MGKVIETTGGTDGEVKNTWVSGLHPEARDIVFQDESRQGT